MKQFLRITGFLLAGALTVGSASAARATAPAAGKESGLPEIGGIQSYSSEDYQEQWKTTPSDIQGMTLWDKYKMGLSVATGSDSDGDGLTDQQEIEIYHSDPLKSSTAGDLYTDGYKVQHDMDLKKKYEYKLPQDFTYNSCPEVELEARNPEDFRAVVKQVPVGEGLGTFTVYAQYKVYNFAGLLSINLGELLEANGIDLSEISVYLSDGEKAKSASFRSKDTWITLKKPLKWGKTYRVFIVRKDFSDAMKLLLGDQELEFDLEPEKKQGDAAIYGFPLLQAFGLRGGQAYIEDMPTEEEKQELVYLIIGGVGETEKYFHVHFRPRYEVKMRGELLHRLMPHFDLVNFEDGNWRMWRYLLFYHTSLSNMAEVYPEVLEKLEGSGETEENKDPDIPASGNDFQPVEDVLPFPNFKTMHHPQGTAAGFSHLTARLYNNGKLEPVGAGPAIWNLMADPENQTLIDPGLSDYKTEEFTQIHQDGDKMHGLTTGEEQFVNMIDGYAFFGKSRSSFIYQKVYGGDHADPEYDYRVITSMMETIDSGKILDVHLRMQDGSAHAVNIYGYQQDPQDPDVVWFSVYDSTYPPNSSFESLPLGEGFRLRVEKRVKQRGEGFTFGYRYDPFTDHSYGANSDREDAFLIIMDEDWQLLMD